MDWHIVTSSKGGVGKTLIALMLLAYYRGRGDVLLIDLNGVNTDLRRLIAASSSDEAEAVELQLEQVGDFYLEKLPKLGYTIGWPKNAFKRFDSKDFHELLIKISTEGKSAIETQLKIDISTIIIDTNDHFCNLFSEQDEDYAAEFFQKESENLFIWFIWAYRQLSNLIEMEDADNPANPHHVDARMVNDLALKIESNIKNRKLVNSPFIHLFSIISLGQMRDKRFSDKLREIFKGTFFIAPLKKLASQRKTDDIKFGDFVNHLKNARIKAIKELETQEKKPLDMQHFFLKVLDVYVSQLRSEHGCPRNVIPIYTYQHQLLGYTDADYDILSDQIAQLDIYKNFEKACLKLLT